MASAFTVPKVVSGVLFMALGLAAYWHFGLTRLRGWPLIAIFAGAVLCFLYGLRLLWAWIDEKPAHPLEIESRGAIGKGVVLLAWVFLGCPALFFLWVALTGATTQSGEGLRILGLIVGTTLGLALAVLTYWRMHHVRYGNSTCRLARPARVGGWLEAQVDCALPRGGDDTVVVHLRNYRAIGRSDMPVWQMEARINAPVEGDRTLVRIRLPVPRARGQQVHRVGAGLLARTYAPAWVLEIDKEAPGIDFHAQFKIPVFDANDPLVDVPAPEAPIDGQARRRRAGLITAAGAAALCIATYQAGQRGWLTTGILQPSSEWLPRARFQHEFDVWSESHYPASMQGRCAEGREEYRSDWEPVPHGATFYSWYAMDRGWFEKRSREYAAQGFRLEASSQFQDCKGAPRFQGTWMKRMLAS